MAIEITPATKITSVKACEQGGVKKKFHELVPKKGSITFAKLKEAATKELGVPVAKMEPWLKGFLRRGLIKLA